MIKILQPDFLSKAVKVVGTIIVLGFVSAQAKAQTIYNYRTKQSGLWTAYTTWEKAPTTNSTNFTPLASTERTPNRNDGTIEILDGHTVTYDYANNIDQVYIKPGGIFELPTGQNINVFVAPSTARIVVEGQTGKQGIFRNLGGTISYTNGTTTVTSNIEIGAFGKYEHTYNNSVGTVPLATWDVNSEIEFNMTGVITGLNTFADYQNRGFAQTFGNVKWNTVGNTKQIDLKGVISNIQGNFEVISTGTGASGNSNSALILSSSGTYNLTIGKNLIVSGAKSDLVFSTSSAPTGGTLNLTLGEGLQVNNGGAFRNNTIASPLKVLFTSSGTLENTSTHHLYNVNYEVGLNASVSLASNLTVPGAQTGGSASNFVVKGLLKANDYVLTANGNFDLQSGSTLQIGSAAGITSAGSTGNIQVAGTRTFSPSANYIYNGTAAQVTGSGLPGTVNELTINNTAGLTLSTPVTVSNSLKMTSGVLNSSSANTITIAATGAVQLPSADKVSYVNGPMGQMVATTSVKTLSFPLGKNGKYRPVILEITQGNATPTTYTAEQFEGAYPTARTLPGSLSHISKVRYYRITQSPVATLNEGLVTLTYGPDDAVSQPGMLSIAKTSGSNAWMDLDGTAPFGAAANEGTIVGGFLEFSDFVLANKSGGANPLPVELLHFNARNSERSIWLDWATATEKNADHFEIERSLDGKIFENIGIMKAAGNSQTEKRYAFEDKNPMAALVYYRLKQLDLDGTFDYSEIKSVRYSNAKAEVNIYPNPANQHLTISFDKEEIGTLQVINNLGQVVLLQTVAKTAEKVLDISSLPTGAYQLHIKGSNDLTVKRFIKMN